MLLTQFLNFNTDLLKSLSLYDRSTNNTKHKPEAVARRYSFKKVFLKSSQNSWENTCVGVFNKVAGRKLFLQRRCFYEFCQVFKSTFFIEHLQWLLLIRTTKQTKSPRRNQIRYSCVEEYYKIVYKKTDK